MQSPPKPQSNHAAYLHLEVKLETRGAFPFRFSLQIKARVSPTSRAPSPLPGQLQLGQPRAPASPERPQPPRGVKSSGRGCGGRTAPGPGHARRGSAPGRLQHRLPLPSSSSAPALPAPPPDTRGETVTEWLLTVEVRRLRPGPAARQQQQQRQQQAPVGGGGTCNTDTEGWPPRAFRLPPPPPGLRRVLTWLRPAERHRQPGRARGAPAERSPAPRRAPLPLGAEPRRLGGLPGAAAGGMPPPTHLDTRAGSVESCRQPALPGTGGGGAGMLWPLPNGKTSATSHAEHSSERTFAFGSSHVKLQAEGTAARQTHRTPEFYFRKERALCSQPTAPPGRKERQNEARLQEPDNLQVNRLKV